ncbi:hypothetical protein MKX03_025926 [Papaver bracteatum]|nr:hypothetical protein MKX03_025926 [Papaver bracteatum]
MGEEIFKVVVWYNGKTVNEDGNNPRYVGGIVKFIDVDPNTEVEAFLCTVRGIFGIPEAVPITMKYHIFFSSVMKRYVADLLESLNAFQSPPTGVEFPIKPSTRGHVDGSLNHEKNNIEFPVLNPIPKRCSNKRSAADRDDSIKPIIVDDRVKKTSSKNSSKMTIIIKSLCGLMKTLYVERNETVGSIRERICKIEGIPVNEQRLSYGTTQLREDDRTLVDLGIENESTINVLLCLRGC